MRRRRGARGPDGARRGRQRQSGGPGRLAPAADPGPDPGRPRPARSGAARAADTPALRPTQPPYFSADVSVSIDTLAHPSVNVTITVPYGELNWNKVPAGYAAGVGFTVELQPVRGDRLYGGSWEKRLTIESYAATRSNRNDLIAQRSYDLPPGRYDVRVHVRDIGSDRESDARDQLGFEPEQAVISVPALFELPQSAATSNFICPKCPLWLFSIKWFSCLRRMKRL